ncbi:diguanylate cyclase [Paenibacillus sp. GSMTC-2017]|uniref:sensor domain-containing diguanylate cyclase n=1 Tax=Paenibacillus sp. GSMTC-2017 TaxID=2794350 RepID=UPI0018D920EA|nr:diguanylate cyclase [Paenibacillus sp. GSMTC-2017]MBH5319388.1 diguanylate cyclase [Paenibacillus sp. GSMTC-2017]
MSLEELYKELDKLKDDENYIHNICNKLKEMESNIAIVAYESAIKFVRENNMSTCAYPWLLYHQGWLYYNLADFNTSIILFEDAYHIFKENNNIDGQLATIGAFVSGYSVQQKTSKAIEHGMEGIALAEKVGNYERTTQIKMNLAALYMEIDNYEKAKELLDQIVNTPRVYNMSFKVVCYINQAECCNHLGDSDQAIVYITKALELAEEYSPKMVPNVLKEMAHIYATKGCYDTAEEYFVKSVEMAKARGEQLFLQDALSYWAELDLVQGRFKETIDKLQQVEEGIEKADSIRNLNKVYLNMSKGFKGLGDYEEAYAYLEKHMELEKQMQSIRSAESMEMLNRKVEEEEGKLYKLLYNQTEALNGVGQNILSNLDKESIFNIVAKEIQNLIQADIVQIGIYNEAEGILNYELAIEKGQRVIEEPMSILQDSFWAYCVKHRQEIVVKDIEKEYSSYFENFKEYLEKLRLKKEYVTETVPYSLIFVPIIMNDKILGILSTQAYNRNFFNLKDLSTLKTLSNYLGIGLENARLYKEVEYASKYDVLTKVFNRKELFQETINIYEQLRESKSPIGTLCILMIDADNFKRINDFYGHQEGDRVLEHVADLIQASLGEKDRVGRYGGEEFMVAIPGETLEQCNQKAESIRKGVENAVLKSSQGIPIPVTVSIGGANLNTNKYTLEQMINYADKELFKAKNAGKNKVFIHNQEEGTCD